MGLGPPFERCLVLTGPTASGKSELALEVAARISAEIVCMDSMTLYRGMDIGTAKPSAAERAAVPHHLLDVLDPWESGSVAWWLGRADGARREIESRGRVVLFVGGTPLYLKALIHGLFPGPPGDVGLRARLESEADLDGPAALHARLAVTDPAAAARLHPNDVRRVVRALEVYELTGRPISDWQREWAAEPAADDGPARVVAVDRPRAELHARINERVGRMLEAGWLEEARRLRGLGRPLSRQALQAVGYSELFRHLDGGQTLGEAAERIRARTRQFAKRQLTWLRSMPGCRFLAPELTSRHWRPRIVE